jgi:diacylglycerol kinase
MVGFLRSRVRSFGYAFQGIFTLFREQVNARIHLLAVGVITILGLWLGLSRSEWCDILLCMALVIVMEGVNTALEYLVDLVSPAQHELAGKTKDVAAGAVLLSVIFCAVVWGLIFLPKLYLRVMVAP